MNKREAPENGDENPAKRQRVVGARSVDTTVSFISLPSDCKVNILSFLPNKDKDSVAECNRDCRQVRANESLSQDRTGTTVWTRRTTMRSFCNKLRKVQDKFTGNRTTLKIVGLERTILGWVELGRKDIERLMDGASFPSVTSLDCSCIDRGGSYFPVFALSRILPNLLEIDLSSNYAEIATVVRPLCETSPAITKLKWNNCPFFVSQCGFYLRYALNLTHLQMDGIWFSCYVHPSPEPPFEEVLATERPDSYLMMYCCCLECLITKGATFKPDAYATFNPDAYASSNIPLPQEMLINMVRRHPTLRWLRGDLTAENVAMLKNERPEITFVSE